MGRDSTLTEGCPDEPDVPSDLHEEGECDDQHDEIEMSDHLECLRVLGVQNDPQM